MDQQRLEAPPPEQVQSPDPEPTAVEFLAELPDYIRQFFDAVRDALRKPD